MLAYSGVAVIVPAGPIGPRGWWTGRAGEGEVGVVGVEGGAGLYTRSRRACSERPA